MRLHVAQVEAKREGLVKISSILVFGSKMFQMLFFFFASLFFFSYKNLPGHLVGNSLESEAGV